MAEHSYTSRRELEQYRFHPVVALLAPLFCIVLGAMLPQLYPPLEILDFPLIVTVFFAVSRRSPIAGALTGTTIGLLQDALTGHPFGVNGIAKAIVGYLGASLGFAVDVDNLLTRFAMNFVASLLQSVILYVITRRLLGDVTVVARPAFELMRAAVTAVVAIPVFLLLDRFRVLAD